MDRGRWGRGSESERESERGKQWTEDSGRLVTGETPQSMGVTETTELSTEFTERYLPDG